MSDVDKAKQEFDAAIAEVVGKFGPGIRLIGAVIKDSIQALQPLFSDLGESLEKAKKAGEHFKQAKEHSDDIEDIRAENARQRSERFH